MLKTKNNLSIPKLFINTSYRSVLKINKSIPNASRKHCVPACANFVISPRNLLGLVSTNNTRNNVMRMGAVYMSNMRFDCTQYCTLKCVQKIIIFKVKKKLGTFDKKSAIKLQIGEVPYQRSLCIVSSYL